MRRPFRAGNRRLLGFGAEHAAGPPQNERVVPGEAGTPTPEDQCAGILARHKHLTPQDYQRIVLGNPEKQVQLFLESFWIDKVRAGDRFLVRDAEILRKIGIGKVVWISDYVGARDFRTEDSLERLDTKNPQAILQLEEATPITLGKIVLCERQPVATK
jgi:hypothetical protein